MKTIIFSLSMPSVGSWNGKWTGASRNYYRKMNLSDKFAAKIGLDESGKASWGYSFGDGWSARVSARTKEKGERLPKSDGFCGYDWMIDSILTHGKIQA